MSNEAQEEIIQSIVAREGSLFNSQIETRYAQVRENYWLSRVVELTLELNQVREELAQFQKDPEESEDFIPEPDDRVMVDTT